MDSPTSEPEPAPPSGEALPEVGEPVVQALPPPAELPTLRSPDNRLELTGTTLRVHSSTFSLLELEGAELTPVRWLLWYIVGILTLAGFAIGFLQNWLRTLPAAAGMAAGALLLAYGRRGTNRLRLHRPGREALHFALPGEATTWQPLIGELNRRIRLRHDEAAARTAQHFLPEAPPPPTVTDLST